MIILYILLLLIIFLFIYEIYVIVYFKIKVKRYRDYWDKKSKENGEFIYLALGDSSAQSIGASKVYLGYVGILEEYISKKVKKDVKVINLSSTGAVIDDVIKYQIPKLKKIKADVITVSIGANDIRKKISKDNIYKKFDKLFSLLPKGSFVADTPFWGSGYGEEVSKYVKDFTPELVSKYGHINVNLYDYTKKRVSFKNYSLDFFHPSDSGYRIWADAFINKMKDFF